MLVFIAIGAAGLVVLLVSMLFGELFDLLDGALSGTGLGAGLTLFGASGVLSLANGWSAAAAYLIAAGIDLGAVLGSLTGAAPAGGGPGDERASIER